jgi:hypothetical protein
MEHASGFDRSELYSDEGAPISECHASSRFAQLALRWN